VLFGSSCGIATDAKKVVAVKKSTKAVKPASKKIPAKKIETKKTSVKAEPIKKTSSKSTYNKIPTKVKKETPKQPQRSLKEQASIIKKLGQAKDNVKKKQDAEAAMNEKPAKKKIETAASKQKLRQKLHEDI
jgi:hypothetical protein